MPTFTIISCINQIIRSKAKPIFVDSDPVTWNMDTAQIESKITDKTKAIMIVHIYGLLVNVEPILELAKKYKRNRSIKNFLYFIFSKKSVNNVFDFIKFGYRHCPKKYMINYLLLGSMRNILSYFK